MGWFVVGLLTPAPVAHVIRTPKLSFIQGRASASLTVMAIVIMAFGIFLPMGRLASHFKLLISPLPYLAWLGAILLAQCLLTTLMKRVYIRRFAGNKFGHAPAVDSLAFRESIRLRRTTYRHLPTARLRTSCFQPRERGGGRERSGCSK